MSNRKKLDPPGWRAQQHRPDHGRHRETATTPGGFAARPGHARTRILAAGVLGSAAVMALPVGAAAVALADARAAGSPTPVSATLTAAVVSPQATLLGSQNGADLTVGSVLSRAFDQPIANSAPADQVSAASMFQGLFNPQPADLQQMLGADLAQSASGAGQSMFPFNVASTGDVAVPANAFSAGPNLNPLENLTQDGNQVLAQLAPDLNGPTIGNTGIPSNQTIQPGGFIPSANGITVNGPGVSVLTDSNGNAQVTIAGGMGPNGPEPATTFTLPPNGEIHLGSGVLKVPSNASDVDLPPGTYTVGDPPPAGQPDLRPKIIVDPPEPPAQPGQPSGGASNDQNQTDGSTQADPPPVVTADGSGDTPGDQSAPVQMAALPDPMDSFGTG